MRVALVGADFEENLGLGMIAAALEESGHEVTVVPFNQPSEGVSVARRVLALAPDVVGLGIQFQHRAHEFLNLARQLRATGYKGHVTCGGQYPTLAWRETLAPRYGIDTVVLHEGEHTITDLLAALRDGVALASVAGLALRGEGGEPVRTEGRRLVDDLDELPFARRYRTPARHMNVPFIPIMGGRGCWGACSYCSITSFYRDARAHGGGRTVRLRSPENVAREMAVLWHAAGGESIFCFHDDNFLLPRPEATLERVRAIRTALDGYDVGRAAFIGKCRPECVTPALARELRALGVLRLYVGVENASEHGAGDLKRGVQWKAIDQALDACRDAGIFVCYNLLIFEPDTTLDDVRENARFIREHADHPVNFCRAEPYHGTPLHLDLAARQSLSGSHLGWDYRLEDPRAELLFRVCAAAFRQRNFDPEGVGNRYMGLGYSLKLLEFFHDDPEGRIPSLARRARTLTREIATDTAAFLEAAIAIAEKADPGDHDAIERQTALLGLEIAAADRVWHAALDALYADMSAFAAQSRRPKPRLRPPPRIAQFVRQAALGASLALWATGAAGCSSDDPVPPDAGTVDDRPDVQVVDPPPPDAGRDVQVVDPAPKDAGMDIQVVDPPPPDAGRVDVTRPDIQVVDPAPVDAGRVDVPRVDVPRVDVPVVVDPPPPDAGRRDALWHEHPQPEGPRRALPLIDQWRETTPRRSLRDAQVALYAPPEFTLVATREEGGVRVKLAGPSVAVSTRWQADGSITGDGDEVLWTPGASDDQIRVAVRAKGGVAVLALRANDVDRRARASAEIREEA